MFSDDTGLALGKSADTSFDLKALVYKNLKKKLPELRETIDGYITPEQASKLKVAKVHHKNLEFGKARLKKISLILSILSSGTCHSSNCS